MTRTSLWDGLRHGVYKGSTVNDWPFITYTSPIQGKKEGEIIEVSVVRWTETQKSLHCSKRDASDFKEKETNRTAYQRLWESF